MNKDIGASASGPGSREPSPDGLGPTGFDPSRDAFDLEMELRRFHARASEAIDAAVGLGWLRQYGRGAMEGSTYANDWRGGKEAAEYIAKATKGHGALILASAIEMATADVARAYRDSDGSGEAGETACGLDPQGDSAGRQASPNPSPQDSPHG